MINVIIFFMLVTPFNNFNTCKVEIKCILNDENKTFDKYSIYGNEKDCFEIVAKDFDKYNLVGKSEQKITFGTDEEVIFYYTKDNQKKYFTHDKYVEGYPDGNFYPDITITLREAIIMLSNINQIKDYNITINELVEKKILKKNNLDNKLTKNEFTNIAINYLNPNYFNGSVHAFLQHGSISKSSYVTRGESIFIINKLIGRDKPIISKPSFRDVYKDVSTEHPYFNEITEASIKHDYIFDNTKERWLSVYDKEFK